MKRAILVGVTFTLTALLTCTGTLAQPISKDEILVKILDNGPTASRINLVFMGDGYTADEMPIFEAWVSKSLDTLFSEMWNTTHFFANYRGLFNVFLIRTPSKESGVTHPGIVEKKTSFKCQFGGNWTSGNCDRSRILDTARKYMPEYHALIMVFNDKGGLRASGGEPIYIADGTYNHTVKHELGHTLANLVDEYLETNRTTICQEGPNTTKETVRNAIKWKAWINPETPIPTLINKRGQIGLFEGAAFMDKGCYRPAYECLMNLPIEWDKGTLVQFCSVCHEEMILSLYQQARPLDSVFPSENLLVMGNGESKTFRVKPLLTYPNTMSVQWLKDGEVVPGATKASYGAVFEKVGTHTLWAIVRDTTQAVKRDLYVLADTAKWEIKVNATSIRKIEKNDLITNWKQARTGLSFRLASESLVSLIWIDVDGRQQRTMVSPIIVPMGNVSWALPHTGGRGGFFTLSAKPTGQRIQAFERVFPNSEN